MASFDGMAIASSGMTAQRLWMDVIASNLANAESTRSADGGPFRRQVVALSEVGETGGVQVASVTGDPAPPRMVYDPGHPDADDNGYVAFPNVEPVRELVDMLNASRAFEANAVAMSTARRMLSQALELGRA